MTARGAATVLAMVLALAAAGCATSERAVPPTSPPAIDEAAAPVGEAPPGEAPPAIEPRSAEELAAAAADALARDQREEANTAIVTAFYEMIFQEHRVAEAFDRYGGDVYIQHSPGAPNGRAAVEAFLTPYFEANPLARSEIRRVVAEGDLVVLHVHAKANPVDRGRAVVEIFRVQNGRIVEHWDVVQPIPPEAANENTMF